MSIANNEIEYGRALSKAHSEFPLLPQYPDNPITCVHNFNFVVFCDGGDWDIVRCNKCGSERVCRCNFDDEYC